MTRSAPSTRASSSTRGSGRESRDPARVHAVQSGRSPEQLPGELPLELADERLVDDLLGLRPLPALRPSLRRL